MKRAAPALPAADDRIGSGAIVAAVVMLLALAWSWQREARFWGLDFAKLWVGGKTAASQGGKIYGPEGQSISNGYLANAFEHQQQSGSLLNVLREREFLARQRGTEMLAAFVATPFLHFTFAVFPSGYDQAWLLYRILCMAATVAACLLLMRLARLPWATSFLVTAAVLVLYEPLASDQRVGNVNRLQLLGIALYLWLSSSHRRRTLIAAGAVLGLLIAFKPNVALIAPLALAYQIFCRRFHDAAAEAVGIVAGGMAAVGVSSFLFGGLSVWEQWMGVASRLAQADVPRQLGNIAVLRSPAAASVLLAIVLAAMWMASRSEGQERNALLAASLGPLIYILSARVAWLHYVVMALPAGILLLDRRHSRPIRITAAVALALTATTPFAPFSRVQDIAVQTTLITTGLFILYGLAVYAVMQVDPVRSGRRMPGTAAQRPG